MAIIPKVIRIVREGDRFSMTVDDEEFPFAIAEDDIEFSMGRLRSGMVRLTLIADRVEVVNDFANPADDVVELPAEPEAVPA
jgi:hypothetical protein